MFGKKVTVHRHRDYTEFSMNKGVSACLLNALYRLNIVKEGRVIDTIHIDEETPLNEIYKIIYNKIS